MTRFTFVCDDENCRFRDNGETIDCVEVVDKLNEQQATIKQLESDKAIAEDYANIFEKENVKLRKQIDEEEAIIEAKNEYQRTLEAKIRRLKDRIKVLEKNDLNTKNGD